jgi:hypothetical protein
MNEQVQYRRADSFGFQFSSSKNLRQRDGRKMRAVRYTGRQWTRGWGEDSHRRSAVVTAHDARAQRKMGAVAAWMVGWARASAMAARKLWTTLCSAALTSGPTGRRGKGGEDSSSTAAPTSATAKWIGALFVNLTGRMKKKRRRGF